MRGIELGEKNALNTAVLRLKSTSPNSHTGTTAFSDARRLSPNFPLCLLLPVQTPARTAAFPIVLFKCAYKSPLWEYLQRIERSQALCMNGKQWFEAFRLTSNLSYKAPVQSHVFIQCLKCKIIDLLRWLFFKEQQTPQMYLLFLSTLFGVCCHLWVLWKFRDVCPSTISIIEILEVTVNTVHQSLESSLLKKIINFIEIEFCKQNARAIGRFNGVDRSFIIYPEMPCCLDFPTGLLESRKIVGLQSCYLLGHMSIRTSCLICPHPY